MQDLLASLKQLDAEVELVKVTEATDLHVVLQLSLSEVVQCVGIATVQRRHHAVRIDRTVACLDRHRFFHRLNPVAHLQKVFTHIGALSKTKYSYSNHLPASHVLSLRHTRNATVHHEFPMGYCFYTQLYRYFGNSILSRPRGRSTMKCIGFWK